MTMKPMVAGIAMMAPIPAAVPIARWIGVPQTVMVRVVSVPPPMPSKVENTPSALAIPARGRPDGSAANRGAPCRAGSMK